MLDSLQSAVEPLVQLVGKSGEFQAERVEVSLLGLARDLGELTGRNGKLWLQDHGQDVWFRNLRWRTIPAEEMIEPEPYFEPLTVTGEALQKEEARVKSMLKAK